MWKPLGNTNLKCVRLANESGFTFSVIFVFNIYCSIMSIHLGFLCYQRQYIKIQ